MKKGLLLFLLILFLSAGALFWFLNAAKEPTADHPEETTPLATDVSAHVEKYYLTDDKLIIDYAQATDPHYLAESIGLYMQYLLKVDDSRRFDQMYHSLLDHFVVTTREGTFLKWEAQKDTSTNAWIDDTRIAAALVTASSQFDYSPYQELAEKINQTDHSFLLVQNRPIDFYDFQAKVPADTLHLSYYAVPEMKLLGYSAKNFAPLKQANADPFFKEVYQNGAYLESDPKEVNMIDQMLIALAYVELNGKPEPHFDSFLQTELDQQGKIFGRYNRTSHKPESQMESTAVYAFLVQYFQKTKNTNHAKIAQGLLQKMDTSDPLTTHFFDYINKELVLTP
ncbi:glycoside transferase [Listeria costaricensis]|uniref:glycoside transferase n=1 Tax=Listeria costaricensis TaxID=2026604 RepID=UPI000C06983D|nr:glycoside transferase [Listeria costaricensis]